MKSKKKKRLVEHKEIRDRIKEHRYIKACDLVKHELNFRTHDENQKKVLRGIYEDVGYSRSSLGFVLPDGRVKLIDGHMRLEEAMKENPNQKLCVEILDVTESEAAKLLATIDPISGMATTDGKILRALFKNVKSENIELNSMWSNLAKANKADKAEDLELHTNGDDDDLTPIEIKLDTSQVVMFQLFLNMSTHPRFLKRLRRIAEEYQTKSPTDTVYKCVRILYKQLKEKKDASKD